MMFLDCPAYLPEDGTARCGLPAEPRCRFTMRSTDGPLESAMITCPAGHWFNGPIEFLIWESRKEHEPGSARVATSARRDSRTGGHDGLDGSGGFVARDSPGGAGTGTFPPERRSCLLSAAARARMDHRHEPAPQAHRIARLV
jgi:hypothetical protein